LFGPQPQDRLEQQLGAHAQDTQRQTLRERRLQERAYCDMQPAEIAIYIAVAIAAVSVAIAAWGIWGPR